MVDEFGVKTFERALPVDKKTKKPLWKSVGIKDGEYTYHMDAPQGLVIQIRSSIRGDGISATTGKDSIRIWLTTAAGMPVGSKVQAYVTRVNGWDKRLIEVLREVWKRAKTLKRCPDCKKFMGIYKVKKVGENTGRLFSQCREHKHFTWLT